MRWSEMDAGRTLTTRGRMKRDRVQDVPLSTAARAVIATLPRIVGQDLVFSTTGRTPISGFSRAKSLLEKRIVEATRDAVTSTAWGRVGAELCAPWRLHDLGASERHTRPGLLCLIERRWLARERLLGDAGVISAIVIL
jgi:hypothetical protein